MTAGRWHDPIGADDERFTPGRTPEAVGEVAGEMLRARGWAGRLRGARVHALWDRIAGQELARHVQPVRLHGGVLVLRAESPAWATQVRYLAAELLVRANEELGEGQVRRVTVSTTRPGGR